MTAETHQTTNKPEVSRSPGGGNGTRFSDLSVAGQSLAIPEDVRNWIHETLLPLVNECRSSGNWIRVSAASWKGDKFFKRASYAVTRKNGAWYDMLQNIAGVTVDEVNAIKSQTRTQAAADNTNIGKRKYTEEQLRSWFADEVAPKIAAARLANNWGILISKQFESDDHYDSCARLLSPSNDRDWYITLKTLGGLADSEIGEVRTATKVAGNKSLSAARRKYDDASLKVWAENHVQPAIEAARESGEWAGMITGRWKDDDHFNSFRSFHGEGTLSWQAALVRRGLITEEENQLISLATRQIKATNSTVYSDQQLLEWIEQSVVPVVSRALRENDWEAIAPKAWENDSHYSIATARLAGRNRNWYGLLVSTCGVTAAQVAEIRATVRRQASADFTAPKFTDDEIDTWVQETLKPVLELARRDNQWDLLRRANWNSDQHCNSAVRRFGGAWDLVLSAGLGLTEGEVTKVKEASRDLQFENLAASRLRKTGEAIGSGATNGSTTLAAKIARRETEFRELLDQAVANARKTGDWTGLTLGALDPESEIVKAGMGLTQITQLREQGLTGWYSVIERYGQLEESEIRLARQAAESKKRRKLSDVLRKFSDEELDQWVAEHVKPVVAQAREGGKWELIMKKHWESHPEQASLCGRFGSHESDWYGALLQCGLISQQELALAREAAQTERTKSGGLKHRKFTEEELTTWFRDEIQPRIAAARRGCDWGELMLAAWRGDPHFGTLNQVFGEGKNDWYKVLAKLGGVTPEEETLIRREGELARVRKRETPQPHGHKYERTSKATRQIIVVERLVLGDGPRQETAFRTVINKLREMESAGVTSMPGRTSEKTRAVLEVNGRELLRDHLSPADQLRLLFSRMRNETDWSFLAQRYQGILPSLSSYLANRAALLYVSSLAEAGTISFPEKGLSVGSGTGDLYDASQELEPMLVRAGQSRPAVTDLDFSAEMLRLSRNPDKVCAPASSIPLNDNSYDLAECSSPYRMGSGADLKSILGEIHRVVRPGGVLWLKADGILFSDSFAASLERMGFDFIAPANSTLCLPPEIVEGLDPKLRQRSLAALKNTHFILAVKSTRTPQEVDATSLTFMRKRTVSEDVEEVQNLLKGLLRSATDNEYIINARTFVGTMSTLAPETFDHKGALAVGLLHKYLGVLFTHDEIGVLPAKRDVVSLHSKLLEHQRLVDGSLRETDQPNTDPDSIVLYVREMKRAVDHLEQLAAQASQ